MKNQKLFKTLGMSVVLLLLVLNFSSLYLIKQQDETIKKLENDVVAVNGRLSDISKETVKIDKGLLKTYTMITNDSTSSTLRQLIDKLVEYGYIEPVQDWEDAN